MFFFFFSIEKSFQLKISFENKKGYFYEMFFELKMCFRLLKTSDNSCAGA